MTPESLRSLRESRGLTRDQLADELGCSASAIVQWELDKRSIPTWVEEKMLKGVKLSFPFEHLQTLIELAKEEGISFEQLLSDAISELLVKRRSKPSALTVNSGQIAAAVDSGSNIMPMPPQHFIAAESPKKDADIPPAKKVSYRSSSRKNM